MDSKILKVLKSYDISASEIKDIINIAPMIDVITYEEFKNNCGVLVEQGYPKSELDFLFLANPNIFVRSVKDLENELKKLKNSYGDIEVVLKQNPMII